MFRLIELCLALILVAAQSSRTLEEALVSDIFPPSSAKCQGYTRTNTTSFTYNFTWSTSTWDSLTQTFEDQVFLAEFGHTDPNTPDRSWKLRVAQGGNIYSFVGPFGEAVPPQVHDGAPWIDEVWQMVAVNTNLNDVPLESYYIHQAGTYQKEDALEDKVFYSPSIAKNCDGNTCTFVSWGQHAHVPTPYISSVLYYTRLTNCGDGLLEITYLIHNSGDPNNAARASTGPDFGTEGGENVNYLNVPWGGVRTSSLQDVLNAPAGGGDAEMIDPLPGFGQETIPLIKNIGGYTVFAENLPLQSQFTMPCGSGSDSMVDCDDPPDPAYQLHYEIKNTCHESAGHTASTGRLTMRCAIQTTVGLGASGCSNCVYQFTSPRNGHVVVNGILHYSWKGTAVYFWPNVTVAEFNAVFQVGDYINVSYYDTGKPPEENRALSLVYGTDQERLNASHTTGSRAWYNSPTRLRIGLAGSARDYTVYTVNPRPVIAPSKTYYYRQYAVTDNYTLINGRSRDLVDDVQQGMRWAGDLAGSPVVLFSADAGKFGAAVDGEGSDEGACVGEVYDGNTVQHQCNGTTTPQVGAFPLFAIQCGNLSYVGINKYHYASTSPSTYTTGRSFIRPYFCDGQTEVRATWTLLGYFYNNSCSFLQDARFSKQYCAEVFAALPPSSAPTSTPSTVPSSSPSTQPSAGPSADPSSIPTPVPTSPPSSVPASPPSSVPTSLPTTLPTSQPTSLPTSLPTSRPSGEPSGQPTGAPTDPPTSMPSEAPTGRPTQMPTSLPSVAPSRAPSSLPTSIPSATPTRHVAPTGMPSGHPTPSPTVRPTGQPTSSPTSNPSFAVRTVLKTVSKLRVSGISPATFLNNSKYTSSFKAGVVKAFNAASAKGKIFPKDVIITNVTAFNSSASGSARRALLQAEAFERTSVTVPAQRQLASSGDGVTVKFTVSIVVEEFEVAPEAASSAISSILTSTVSSGALGTALNENLNASLGAEYIPTVVPTDGLEISAEESVIVMESTGRPTSVPTRSPVVPSPVAAADEEEESIFVTVAGAILGAGMIAVGLYMCMHAAASKAHPARVYAEA